jgi:signal transduction histidine kinase
MTPPECVPNDKHAVLQIKLTGFCTPFEKEFIRKDGSRVPILLGGTLLSSSPMETLCFVLDLSGLKRAEAELRKAHDELETRVEERTQELAESIANLESEVQVRKKTEERLRELSARLFRLQDEERRRVARDLHDSTGQTLTALKMTLASLENLVASVPKAPNLLDDLNALADQALQEIRTTSHLLHPPLLDEAGFSSAAKWYVDGFSKRSGVKNKLEISTLRLTRDAELILYRVLQESLSNVLRHSGSETVDIRLSSDDQNAVMSIRDLGRGIPAETLKSFNETGAGVGVGLASMKQRVGELGGQLRVKCNGKGTCVTATVPLAKPETSTCNHDPGAGQTAPAA